jgi:hypothetical protein
MTHIRLVLSRSAEQQAALNQYLSELQDKSSPNFHKWLTPDQFGKLYGPADSDIAAIVAWLQSSGLKLEAVSTGRTDISLSGTVSQVEAAFRTRIHSFNANGRTFYANTVNPSIPTALASVVTGVAQLNSIHPRPHHTSGSAGRYDSETKRLVALTDALKTSGSSGARISARPSLTGGTGTADEPYTLYLVPGDAATIYDTPNSLNTNFSSGTSYTGTGVTIGVIGDAVIQSATVVDYRTRFLGNTTAPTITYTDDVKSTDDTDEAYIDTELAGGLAPAATIHYYASTDLNGAIEQAINDNTIDLLSLSFGECEWGNGSSGNAAINAWWEQAASQGIAVTVSAGDNGSAGCDDTTDANGNNIATAQYGLQVNGLASTPYNIAVGGTDFYALSNSFSSYVLTTTSGSLYTTAKSYIPESTWNDSTQNNTTISLNVPYTGTDATGTDANIVAGSGGKSNCAINTNTSDSSLQGSCTQGYVKPTWQRGTGVPADGVRDLPDVSLMAGNGADLSAWAICTDDTYVYKSATYTENCATDSTGSFSIAAFGGTSTASPAFAGILALVQQKTGSRLGLANYALYDLYNGANSAAIFHDVNVGNISVSCTNGTTNCVQNSAGNYYLSGYDTATGYDLATGMGSVDATQLINYWGTATGAGTTTVTVAPAALAVTTVQPLTVVVSVSPAGALGAPLGTLTLSSGSYVSAAETPSAGSYTFTIPAGALATGTVTLTGSYSGDTAYGSATGSATVVVTGPLISLSPTSLAFGSVAVGTTSTSQTVTVTNSGNAPLIISSVAASTGFAETNTCGTVAAAGTCVITVTFSPTSFTAQTGTLTITDNAPGSPQTVALTGTGVEAGSYTLSASAVTVAPGASGTSTITATGINGYDGSPITLNSCVAATAPTGANDPPICTIGTSSITLTSGTGTGTVSISTTAASSDSKKANQQRALRLGQLAGAGGLAVASLLIFGIPARKRNWRSMLGVLVLMMGMAGLGALSGCGGGSTSTITTNTGTTAGTYTFTVTGTDAAGTKTTATVTVTVS